MSTSFRKLLAAGWIFAVGWTAQAQVPQQILFPGTTGSALYDSLRLHYKPVSTLGYDTRARDQMYGFVDNVGGTLTCIYTGRVISVPANVSTARAATTAQDFNAEHIWPQSKGAQNEPARSDLHSLRPAYMNVNASRNNSAFGYLAPAQVITWWKGDVDQSAIPSGDLGLWSRKGNNDRFQPRDATMGDVARAAFYFFTMYRTEALLADPLFFESMRADLASFHIDDPVDQAEYDRTWRAASLQQNRPNPFIIDTTLVRRLYVEGYVQPDPPVESGDHLATFDNAVKTGYVAGSVQEADVTWFLREVLVGSSPEDLRVGAKSLRFRTHSSDTMAVAEMLTDRLSGIGTVRFQYARSAFSGDRTATAPTFVVEVRSGDAWHIVGEPISLDGVDALTERTITVDEPGPARIRFRVTGGTSGRRFNLDEIRLTPFAPDSVTWVIPLSPAPGYRLLTSPVTTTYAALLEPVFTQYAVGSDLPGQGEPHIYRHIGGNWHPVADLNDEIERGEAFAFGYFGAEGEAAELSVRGARPAGPYTFTAPETGGDTHILIGNPYARGIAFGQVRRQGGAYNQVWVWDPTGGFYRNWSGGFGNFDGNLAAFQGFWVAHNGTGSWAWDRSAFVEGSTLYAKTPDVHQVVVEVEAGGRKDQAVVGFHTEALVGRDGYDAGKLPVMDPQAVVVSTGMDGRDWHTQVLPLVLEAVVELPLRIRMPAGSEPVGARVVASHLPVGWQAFVRDSSLVIDPVGSTSADGRQPTAYGFKLNAAYPNPFNPTTVIGYRLSVFGQTRLAVYDLLGREVAVLVDSVMPAGAHSVNFDASGLSSGVYLLRLESGGEVAVVRVTLLK